MNDVAGKIIDENIYDDGENEEPYYPHYNGFQFISKKAQYRYLRSLWPHHQHKILCYMRFKYLMNYEPYVTIYEIANELEIHKARASLDLKKMVNRKHLKSWREIRPYQYYLTDQGMVFADYIWWNFQKYNLDLFRYFKEIYNSPDVKLNTNGINEDFEESLYQSEVKDLDIEFAWYGMLYIIDKKEKEIDQLRSKNTIESYNKLESLISEYVKYSAHPNKLVMKK
jgi:hypothetical protein